MHTQSQTNPRRPGPGLVAAAALRDVQATASSRAGGKLREHPEPSADRRSGCARITPPLPDPQVQALCAGRTKPPALTLLAVGLSLFLLAAASSHFRHQSEATSILHVGDNWNIERIQQRSPGILIQHDCIMWSDTAFQVGC